VSSTTSLSFAVMSGRTTTFTNCRLCIAGKLVQRDLVVSNDIGRILYDAPPTDSENVDLGGAIVAPGFIELQTNGMRGFHFTHFEDEQSYADEVDEIARYLPSTGCTAFYATIPTVSSDDFKKVSPPCLETDNTGG
jgi:N-acetylglucosamine-6-phosphate deacetylase